MSEDEQKKVEEAVKETKPAEETPAKEEKPEKVVELTIEEKREAAKKAKAKTDIEDWKPKTTIGKKVKSGEITDIDELLDSGERILEPEIIDILLPDLESDLLLIGQSKGKFGGGQRRIFRQTQKKTREGNKPKFSTCAVVGDKSGHIGIGFGKAKETVPAREKSIRRAKLNLIKIRRGSGSWESSSPDGHSIPFTVSGKCGSVKIKIMPAPKGKGLVIEKECAKILALAGISDVFSQTQGQTVTKSNLIKACFEALKETTKMKISPDHVARLSIVEGGVKNE